MSITQDIKDFALDLGYSRVGITTADPFPDYIAELEARYDMYSFYINGPSKPLQGAIPRSIMPSAKSIITMVYDFFKESFPEKLVGKIGRIYQARCYMAPPNRINGARLQLMRKFLERNGCVVYSSSELRIPERMAACRAGSVSYGKNGFAYANGIGSFVLISAFIVDRELEYDNPDYEIRCPSDCHICIDSCPTGALYEPMKIDPRRCIGFNHWSNKEESQGYLGQAGGYILSELREQMGSWIHGCDICQEVCPRNRKKLEAVLPDNEFLTTVAKDFEFIKLLKLEDEFYDKRVYPLMYNYIRDRKYFRRNAAVALGNTQDRSSIPALKEAMEDPEAIVRGHVAWALGKIGGDKARTILESSLLRENNVLARAEIKEALSNN